MAAKDKKAGEFHSDNVRGAVMNRSEICYALDIALTTLDSWVRKGCPALQRGGGRGQEWQFSLAAVVKWKTSQDVSEATGKTQQSDETLKRRRVMAEVQQAELALAKELGQVAPLDQVERMAAKAFAEVRTNLRNIPSRVVSRLIGETDERRFKQVLLEEIDIALEALANAELTGNDDDQDGDGTASA